MNEGLLKLVAGPQPPNFAVSRESVYRTHCLTPLLSTSRLIIF